MKIKFIQKDEYIIKYKKSYDDIQHEYAETFIHEPEFKFRLKYLKSEEGIIDIKAYHAIVIEYDINTL